jgi:hypothetical protein
MKPNDMYARKQTRLAAVDAPVEGWLHSKKCPVWDHSVCDAD